MKTDILTHRTKDPEKCLHEAERGGNKMYLQACLQQRRYFSPFVASVDGLMGVEATATLKRLSSRLATKWKQSYSRRVDTSRVGLQSLWCAPPTAAYKDPWCQRTGSMFSGPSGRTERGSTYFGKYTRAPPTNLIPSTPHSPENNRPSPTNTTRSKLRRQHRRREFREVGTGYTCPPLRKRHNN